MEHASPGPSYEDIKELIQTRSGAELPYLTYITGEEGSENTRVSYSEFYRHVLGCARFLQNHGLMRGDRIATISHNHWHTAVQYFACWLLGLVVIPVNVEEDDDDIAYILEKGNVELAFVRTEYRTRFRKILELYDNLKHIEWIVCEGEISNFTSEKGTLAYDDSSHANSEALIVFTSEGNGTLRGALLTQRNLLEEARAIADWHSFAEGTRVMCALPIHHVKSLVLTLVAPFFAGGSAALAQSFQAPYYFGDIAAEKVHIASLEPEHLHALNQYFEEQEPPPAGALRYMVCEGAAAAGEAVEIFEKRFDIPVVLGYSLPETSSYCCFMPVDMDAGERKIWRRQGHPCVGRPISSSEIAIHNQQGDALGEKEHGEIVIRGSNVMLKYFNDRDANNNVFKHGWLHSGDEGFYVNDEEGQPYFFVVDGEIRSQ